MGPEEEFLSLPGDRVLCYAIYGDRSATATATIFFNHGLPGCHIEALGYDAAAIRAGLRIIAVDRPGMGGSTPVPDRRILDWPADLLRLADALHVERFGVLGVSGGVPYTLACLREIPRARCVGGGVIAGIYPFHLGLAGMMLQARVLLSLGAWSPWLVEKALDLDMGAAARDAATHPERLEKQLGDSLQTRPEPDRAAWEAASPEMRAILVEDLRRGLLQGCRAAAWEIHLAATDWGFELDELAVEPGKFVMWHGAHDVNAPVAMANKAHALIKGAEMRVSEADGHLSMSLGSLEEVVETLSGMLLV